VLLEYLDGKCARRLNIGEARIAGATARGMKITLTPTGEAGTP